MAAMQPVSRPRIPVGVNLMDDQSENQPPILDYSDLIDEEEDAKKGGAVMKYTGRDPARTTIIMDASTKYEVLALYFR